MEELTQLQKIAIEGEVAKVLSTARHNEEVLYRLYVVLKQAPRDTAKYAIDIVKKLTEVDRTELDRVILEVSSKERPLWIWINKTIADIKLSLTLAAIDGSANLADMDRNEIHKKIVKSAFVMFCRSNAIICTRAVRELCQAIIDREPLTLDFLQDVCFTIINDLVELPETTEVTENLFHSMFSVQDILSFRMEKEAAEKEIKEEVKENKYAIKEPQNKEEEDLLAKAISDAVTKVVKKYEKDKKYAVVKRYEGSQVSTVLKCYKSKAKAEEFVKTMKKEYPELLSHCTLTIIPVSE